MDTTTEITLGGRVFLMCTAEDMTFDQFSWIKTAADKAGLSEELAALVGPIIQKAQETGTPLPDDEAGQVSAKMIARAFEGNAHLDVLSGMMVERGRAWTREEAERTKAFIAGLKGRQNFETINVLIGEAILGFFYSVLDSMTTSPNSSPALATVLVEMEKAVEHDQESGLETSGS